MSENKFSEFKNLHQQEIPLILVNIWDAGSALVVQSNGALALATSSASLAWSNGYSDGGGLPLDILMNSVSSILRVSNVPVSIDIENGYSDSPEEVAKLVKSLVDNGVSGINIEDGDTPPELLINKIMAIRELCGEDSVFINARTDVYLRRLASRENRIEESKNRLEKYVSSGANGVFVPGVTSLEDISVLCSSIPVPLNIMVPSDVSNFEEFVNAGVARISLGPATFIDSYSQLSDISNKLLTTERSFELSYDTLNRLSINC